MEYRYFNDYPILNESVYDDQTQIKSVIKQVYDAFKHVGLVQTGDLNQLDINNIPDLDLLNGLNVDKSSNAYSYSSSGTYVQHKPLIFAFTDTLQSTSPIYIKLNFEIGRMRYYTNTNLPANTLPKYPIAMSCQINIASETDGNGNLVGSTMRFIRCQYSINGDRNYNTKFYNYNNYSNSDSLIIYNKEKGIFYVNICSGMRMGATWDTNFVDSNNTRLNSSLLNFCVYRVNDKVVGGFGTEGLDGVATSSAYQTLRYKYMKGKTIYNDNPCYTSNTLLANQGFVNGKIQLQPMQLIDPVTKEVIRKPEFLLFDANLGKQMDSTLTVKISETEKYRYHVFTGDGFQYTTPSSTSFASIAFFKGE